MRTHAKYTVTAAAGAALTLLLTACGQESDDAAQGSQLDQQTSSQSATPPSTSQPSSSEQPEPTSTEAPSSTSTEQSDDQGSAPGVRLCDAGDLEIELGTGDSAAGTYYAPLQFHNVSPGPCDIQGYPGVSYVAGDDGHQVGPAAYREGGKGNPVTVPSDGWAHVNIGFVQVHNFDPGVCKPTAVRGLRVYAPQETQSQYVPMNGNSREGCAGGGIPGNQLTVDTMKSGQAG